MVLTPAERSRRYRARKGAQARTGPEPCGTTAAWNRHVRERAKLRRDGVPDAELPPIDPECRAAAQRHQEAMRARRRATEAPAAVVDEPVVEAAPVVVELPAPAKPVKVANAGNCTTSRAPLSRRPPSGPTSSETTGSDCATSATTSTASPKPSTVTLPRPDQHRGPGSPAHDDHHPVPAGI